MEPILKPKIKYTDIFIGNKFVPSKSGKTFATKNPYTLEEIAQVQEGFKEDIDDAVRSAELAFSRDAEWRNMDASARGAFLYKLATLIERDVNYLASLESYNNGKPFVESFYDVMAAVLTLKFYAGAADKVNGQVLPADGNGFSYTVYEPVGVCGAITPWNYPFLMAVIKLAPCVVMGNTLVLKPAEQTPLTALALAALTLEAGLPPGVFNVVPGFGPTAGAPLVQHPTIRKITFTGSTEVGKLIQREAAGTVKRVSLELGGKSALIVFPDADLNRAVEIAHKMVMINQGQCCAAASRAFVHESIYDEFVRLSVELAKKRVIGNPLDIKTTHGPQIDEDQCKKIVDLIESGKKEGARLEIGGKRRSSQELIIEPTVFSQVTDDMRIAKEEIFGPVQQILKFSDIDEVIQRANSSNYGLAAGVLTTNLETAFKVSSRLEAGQVYVNNYFDPSIQVPFGGFKESGIGREFGLDGLRQYYEIKSVMVDLPFKV